MSPLAAAPGLSVIVERRPDLDDVCPFDAATAVRDLGSLVLLESGRTGAHPGWTFVAAGPLVLEDEPDVAPDPFRRARRQLARLAPQQTAPSAAPPWTGGLAGYLAYDLGRTLECLPGRAADDQRLPVLHLGLYDWVVAWDRRTAGAWFASRAVDGDRGRMHRRRDDVLRRLEGIRRAGSRPGGSSDEAPRQFSPNLGRAAFMSIVERARTEIALGELYQVNLARRLEAPFECDPWPLYGRLARGDPAAFGGYLELGTTGGRRRALLSASPERFLAVSADGGVASDPIKGTRRRGATAEDDRTHRHELLRSDKDRAENVMIVDVLRNDLGRVCVPGSVGVPRLCRLERTRTVQHLVSRVTGRLSPDRDAFDLLAAAFPGGSVTGAPKIRAMKLIDVLEPVRRGPYTGAALWIGADGAMGSSILIRTFVADGARLTVHVGGGITWRSDPAAEWEETRAKASGPLAAMGAIEVGS